MDHNDIVVGIVTIDDYTNYGNRLQNYALTRLLEQEGIKVINGIQVYTKDDWVNRTRSLIKRIIKRMIPYYVVKGKLCHDVKVIEGVLALRQKRFYEFTNHYATIIEPITCSSHKQAYKKLSKKGIKYFITGSDQVWNPYYEANEYQFLSFAPKTQRLSFAASMGVDHIPEKLKWHFKKNLNDMKYISVREECAARIVEDLTGRIADVTLDPTLLLEKAEWERMIEKPKINLEKEYICTYFLGKVPAAVESFAEEKGLKVYSLNSLEEDLFTISPSEFLYIIKNAKYVLTDSFHAVAFSIKFNREFYVFDRQQHGVSSMFSRIETITKRFGLQNRIQNRDRINEQAPISNWKEIEEELVAEKKKSVGKLLKEMGK